MATRLKKIYYGLCDLYEKDDLIKIGNSRLNEISDYAERWSGIEEYSAINFNNDVLAKHNAKDSIRKKQEMLTYNALSDIRRKPGILNLIELISRKNRFVLERQFGIAR